MPLGRAGCWVCRPRGEVQHVGDVRRTAARCLVCATVVGDGDFSEGEERNERSGRRLARRREVEAKAAGVGRAR